MQMNSPFISNQATTSPMCLEDQVATDPEKHDHRQANAVEGSALHQLICQVDWS